LLIGNVALPIYLLYFSSRVVGNSEAARGLRCVDSMGFPSSLGGMTVTLNLPAPACCSGFFFKLIFH